MGTKFDALVQIGVDVTFSNIILFSIILLSQQQKWQVLSPSLHGNVAGNLFKSIIT